MAKKFIIAKSATPIEYKIASQPPEPEPKGSGATGDVLALKLDSDSDITVSKVSLVIEEA